jgi:hypothetical protein
MWWLMASAIVPNDGSGSKAARARTAELATLVLIDTAQCAGATLRKFHHQFQAEARKPTIALIANGIASGDFPAHIDPELAAFVLLGAVFFCRLMTRTPFPQERLSELIDTIFGSNG